jgi:hypothetical protein
MKENVKKVYHNHNGSCGGGNAVYGLGLIGAAIYYIQQADTLWQGVIGLGKAIVWPVYLIYTLLEYFKL